MAIWDDIIAMLKAPFVGPLDLEDLFVIVGAVLIFIMIWTMILYHIRIAAEEI